MWEDMVWAYVMFGVDGCEIWTFNQQVWYDYGQVVEISNQLLHERTTSRSTTPI